MQYSPVKAIYISGILHDSFAGLAKLDINLLRKVRELQLITSMTA